MSEHLGPFELDASVRRAGPGGRLLIGGSPLRLFRLSDAGAELLDSVSTGSTVRSTPGVRALLGRLVVGGVLHPVPPPLRDRAEGAAVTVVVPVRDHTDALARLLGSLQHSEPAPGRVVVVDDGSRDPQQVRRVVERSCAAGLRVDLERRDESGGPGAARNAGAALVETPLAAFVDADCTVSPDWLGPLLAQLSDESVAAAAPRVVAASTAAAGHLERYDAARSPLDLGVAPARVEAGTRVSYVPSAALVMRIDEFRQLGGFDAALRVGEDVDLVWRSVGSGARVRYEPRSIVHHEVRSDLRSWCRQRFTYGTSAAALDRRHRGQVAPVICSPWSAAVWALICLGHPVSGVALAVGTTARLQQRLEAVPLPEVARLALGGHLSAGLQLAHAWTRVWWPVALVGSALSGRVRRITAAALVVSVASAVREGRGRERERAVFGALGILDDAAYGAGVWFGCLRERSLRSLLPTFRGRQDH